MKYTSSYVKLLLLLISISSQLTQALPTHISVSGITSPAAANGIYTISGSPFKANTSGGSTYSYYYWTYTNGGTTYFIYFHQYSGNSYYWDIDTDMLDSEVLFYSQLYLVDATTIEPLQPDNSNFVDVSPNLTTGWAALSGTGVPNIVAAPTAQAASIQLPSNAEGSQLNISWANGNGTSRAVFMKQGTGAITNPADGSIYTASTNWSSKGTQLGSSGYYCIYNGTGNSVSVTTTVANTQYTVQVFDYNGTGNLAVFNTSTVTGNPSNATSLPVELTSFTASTADNKVILNWQTSTEVNNYGFDIERKAAGNWSKVGFIEGRGTTNAPQSYRYTDHFASEKVAYRLKQIDRDGKFEYSKEIEATITAAPVVFALAQNYPNPFNPNTVINYSVASASHVSLKVFDLLGREVVVLVNTQMAAGSYAAQFDGSHLSSGLYFYTIKAGNFAATKKLLLAK